MDRPACIEHCNITVNADPTWSRVLEVHGDLSWLGGFSTTSKGMSRSSGTGVVKTLHQGSLRE